jgi:thymidylate synthase (FAD)
MINVTYIDHMGTDLTVANAARVSFGKRSEMDTSDVWGPPKLKDKDAKLIRYLAEHKHISPFGHCFASFHVKAPVFVARQLVKHKFLRWNEISRRYVDSEPEFYMPRSWRGRSEDKKQGSSGEWYDEDTDISVGCSYTACFDTYKELLDEGICPEQARMVLPQSMMTEWYWSGSLDAFSNVCNLRCKPDTQAETAEVAWDIDRMMIKLFPVSWKALRENQ